MSIFYNYLEENFPYHWPPDETLLTIVGNGNYQIAFRYLIFDISILLIALLWGAGLCGALIRREHHSKPSLQLSTLALIFISAGIAIIIAELFILVLFKALTPTTVITLLIITSVVSCRLILISWKDIQKVTLPINKLQAAITLLVILILAIYQFSSISLWTLGDSTKFHAPYALFFTLNKGLGAIPEYLIYPYHSLNLNLLYSLGILIENNLSYLQTMHALFATLTAFGIYCMCTSSRQKFFLAILLPLVFISDIYIVHFSRFAANVDLGSMFFILCTAFTLYLWINLRSQWLLIISAISFGMAIGTKYLMWVFALPIAICILLVEGRNWKPMMIYICCTAAWGLWWYIRNFVYTGNPVHPFASSIFGLYLWDQSDVVSQMSSLQDVRISRNLAGSLLMPYYAFKDTICNVQGSFLIIAALYLSTPFCWLLNKAGNTLLIFSWIYLVSWFLGSQDARHLMPIMPLVLVYCGLIVSRIFDVFFRLKYGKIVSGLLIMFALGNMMLFVQQQFIRVFYAVNGSPTTIIDKVMRQNVAYDLVSHANGIFDEKSIVYQFYMGDVRWFFKGTFAGNEYGPHGYQHMADNSANDDGGLSPKKLEKNLKEKYSAEGFLIPRAPHMPYDENEFDQVFNLMYRNEVGSIYRFKIP